MRELEEKEIKEIKELEKLTTNELGGEITKIGKDRYIYIQEAKRKIKVIDTAIKAHKLIEIYKKDGFEGVYKVIDFYKNHNSPEEGSQEDDIPF
ncbi:hypothetical protein ES703_121494 [subsurface metagenome]